MLSYCAYKDCTNKNVPCSSITFFTLPKDHRRQIWIENSGNPLLKNISPKAVRNFCEEHFDPIYLKRQFHRTTLYKTAIPYKYTNETHINKQNINESSFEQEKNSYIGALQRNSAEKPSENSIRMYNQLTDFIHDEQTPDEEDGQYLGNDSTENENDDDDDEYDHVEYIMSSFHEEESEKTDNTEDFGEDEEKIQTEELQYECDTNNVEDDGQQQQQHPKVEIIKGNEMKTYVIKSKKHKLDDDGNVTKERPVDKKSKKRSNEKFIEEGKDFKNMLITACCSSSADSNDERRDNVSSSSLDYEEDKHFALSLVGYFQRLSLKKKSVAKIKILQYLTELQYDENADIL